MLADPEFNDFVLKMAEAKGLSGVNLAVAAESLYFGAKKPLRTIEDFRGLKLRVNATPAERARMAALGATAVPMGLPEMITSLQNGVIDGTMSGISIFTNFNLQNIGKTLLETHDTLLVSYRRHEQAVARQAAARSARHRGLRGPQIAAMGAADGGRRGGRVAPEVDRPRRRDRHLPPAEQVELEKRLKPIGAEVTKDDPVLKAFYEKTQAMAAKYQ